MKKYKAGFHLLMLGSPPDMVHGPPSHRPAFCMPNSTNLRPVGCSLMRLPGRRTFAFIRNCRHAWPRPRLRVFRLYYTYIFKPNARKRDAAKAASTPARRHSYLMISPLLGPPQRIAFVGIDICIAVANFSLTRMTTAIEHQLTVVAACNDLDNILVRHACGRCIGTVAVDIPLGNDNALANLHLACRTDKLATGRPTTSPVHAPVRQYQWSAHRSCSAPPAWRCGTTENRNIGKLLLRADSRHALVRRVLARAESSFSDELISFAEQGLQIGLGYYARMTGEVSTEYSL